MLNSGYNSRAVCTAISLQTNAASTPNACFIWQSLSEGHWCVILLHVGPKFMSDNHVTDQTEEMLDY